MMNTKLSTSTPVQNGSQQPSLQDLFDLPAQVDQLTKNIAALNSVLPNLAQLFGGLTSAKSTATPAKATSGTPAIGVTPIASFAPPVPIPVGPTIEEITIPPGTILNVDVTNAPNDFLIPNRYSFRTGNVVCTSDNVGQAVQLVDTKIAPITIPNGYPILLYVHRLNAGGVDISANQDFSSGLGAFLGLGAGSFLSLRVNDPHEIWVRFDTVGDIVSFIFEV